MRKGIRLQRPVHTLSLKSQQIKVEKLYLNLLLSCCRQSHLEVLDVLSNQRLLDINQCLTYRLEIKHLLKNNYPAWMLFPGAVAFIPKLEVKALLKAFDVPEAYRLVHWEENFVAILQTLERLVRYGFNFGLVWDGSTMGYRKQESKCGVLIGLLILSVEYTDSPSEPDTWNVVPVSVEEEREALIEYFSASIMSKEVSPNLFSKSKSIRLEEGKIEKVLKLANLTNKETV